MQIRINGEEREVAAATLEELLAELGYGDQLVGTALNLDFVRAKDRADARLKQGDAVEILAPKQGG
ncbi:sulfur carrier protein ThiS [Methylocystis heyeri]|uniref:Sulfur carrier protein ThiS n=1 Tax=Methylocystis heyeri TaxID=391905 RepID=A0A6B8KJ51_9HYPH|nr:sulfur carrier protein ThiS [Methylocystis heyeri]QGM46588.1 sulfur carrier protein ThiS [Methylocystis heyeri]